MTDHLTIVARIQAHPDHVAAVKSQLRQLIEPTRREEGCLQYDLHQDNQDPTVFLFYENWTSRALWQAHMNSAHIKAYRAATEGAVAAFSLNEMQRIA